jgi:hypothetical protein
MQRRHWSSCLVEVHNGWDLLDAVFLEDIFLTITVIFGSNLLHNKSCTVLCMWKNLT